MNINTNNIHVRYKQTAVLRTSIAETSCKTGVSTLLGAPIQV
jgi:hypothetical protein